MSASTIVPWAILILGIVITGIGCVTWRSGGGNNLALSGATNVALAATLLLRDSGGMWYASLAVVAVLVLTNFVTVRRAIWRLAEVRLMLATMVVLVALIWLTQILAQTHVVLLVLIVAFYVIFVASMVLLMVRGGRLMHGSRPATGEPTHEDR